MSRLSPTEIQPQLATVQEALRLGDLAGAVRRADSILRSNPDCATAYMAKGIAMARQGRPNDAREFFRTALRHEPMHPEALSWAAINGLNLGDAQEALTFARRLTKVEPDNARAYFLWANALCVQGRLLEALEPIDRALSIEPGEPDYVGAKAQILGRLNWSSQAIEWYRRLLQVRPSPEMSLELADVLLQEGHVAEALGILEETLPLLPAELRPYALLAQAYTEARQFDQAATAWGSAGQFVPEDPGRRLAQIKAEINAGRLAVAEELIRNAMIRYPGVPQFYARLATIKKITPQDLPAVERMEELQRRSDLDADARADLSYGLAKAYHDLGDYGRAIDLYDEANRLNYENSPIARHFDPEAWRAYTDLHIEFFTKERIRELASRGLPSEMPLFIVGMIRSGTTLTEQILSNHSQVRDGGETTFWPDHRNEILEPQSAQFDVPAGRRLGSEFLGVLEAGGRSPRVTEKNPSNVMLSAMLHCVYPNAKLLHIKRQPVDNLLSIWMTPLRTGLPFVHHREHLVAAYRDYMRLVRHLEAVLPEDRFATFTYEAITSSPTSTIEGMLNFLDLEREEACFHPETNPRTVRTPSFYQVRQPINTGSQEKWRHYEPWLGAFRELL